MIFFSPNTPGLRDLQHEKELKILISSVLQARNSLKCNQKPPIMIKIAPDLTYENKEQIANIVMENKVCKYYQFFKIYSCQHFVLEVVKYFFYRKKI